MNQNWQIPNALGHVLLCFKTVNWRHTFFCTSMTKTSMFVFASSRSLFAESQTPWNKLNYKHFQTKTKCLKCFQNSLWQHRWCSWLPQQTRLSPQPPGKGKVVILSTFYLFLLSKKCFTCCMYLNIIFLLDASTCLIKPTKRLRALSVLLFVMLCH